MVWSYGLIYNLDGGLIIGWRLLICFLSADVYCQVGKVDFIIIIIIIIRKYFKCLFK
jgi:hypothetical protein